MNPFTESGFAALVSVSVIGALLLSVVASASYAGFYARNSIAAYEAREAARDASDACVEALRLRLASEPEYEGGDTITVSEDIECLVDDVREEGSATERIYATIISAYRSGSKVASWAPTVTVEVKLDPGTLQVVSVKEIPNARR